MAVKIRLQRGGAAHAPHYRIVVAESRFRRDGRFIEVIGRYNPVAKRHSDKCTIVLDRADHWLSVGAQPSGTVKGLINRFRRGFYEPTEEELAGAEAKAAPAPAPAKEEPKEEAPVEEEVKAEEPAAEEASEESEPAGEEAAQPEVEATAEDANEEEATEEAEEEKKSAES
jgi:small subunit ribosomal protein S16